MSIVGAACRETASTSFDSTWFGLTDRRLAALDSRQRTTLELAVEALDDSGLGHLARGTNAAVVFGAAGSGSANTARYVSHALDLHGPSLAVDSGHTSPLTAVDTAVRLLADESIPFVLTGGADLALLPDISGIEWSGADHTCTVMVLQRTADLPRTGTRAHAEITGYSTGLGGADPAATRIPLRATDTRDIEIGSDETPSDTNMTSPAPAQHNRVACSITMPRQADSLLGRDRHGTERSALGATAFRDRTRYDTGDDPPILIPLSGQDARSVQELATRWAARLGDYRTVREFATAVARLVPGPARAALLVRDRADAATQLRTLTMREVKLPMQAAPPPLREATPPTRQAAPPAPEATQPAQETTMPARGTTPPAREAIVPAQAGALTPCEPTLPTGAAIRPGGGVATADGPGGVLFLFSGGGGHSRMGRSLAARYPVFANAVTAVADAIAEAGGPRVWTPRHGFGTLDGGAYFGQPAHFAFQVALAELLASWGVHPDAVSGHGAGEVAAAVVSGALTLADGARVIVARGRLLAKIGEPCAAAVLEATPAEAVRLVEPMRAEVGIAAIDGPRSITVAGDPRYIDALVRRAHRRAIFAQRADSDTATGSAATAPHIPRARDLASELTAELQDISPRVPDCTVYSTTVRGYAVAPHAAGADAGVPGGNRLSPGARNGTPGGASSSVTDTVPGASGYSGQQRVPAPAFTTTDLSGATSRGLPGTTSFEPAAAVVAGSTAAQGAAATVDAAFAAAYWGRNAAGPVELGAALELAAGDGVSTVLEISPQPVLTRITRQHSRFHESTYPVSSRGDEAATFLRAVARLFLEGRWIDWAALGPFTAAPPQRHWRRELPAPRFPKVPIRADGTYVVAGGLGARGAVAVRWLIDAGAQDVVVLTRAPRPLPPPLDGMEDRIVLVRCDASDRTDLAGVLQDIRECGSEISGVVYAGRGPESVTAANLVELTVGDPIEFVVFHTESGVSQP
ncbi:acyltransferase domain-containing protein [Nocardia huaxiensis]|uniref:acyltransferase domain-containing protein n=1 Tax=Nocardia huaxiensis TaxID=2755382 RepID=UPI001E62A10E|nr:acyltransferase domain-containing protein [Nocardia huaxiensis]UFS94498.1 acyltransferase domain-containing protein [Nocardia huaxiensis]